MVKRFFFLIVAALVAQAAPAGGDPGARFETKLSPEQKIEHALSRLTFGARPGDAAEIRKIGLEKWIEMQLHPERIAENPALDARLKPLETIRMPSVDIAKEYFLRPPGMMAIVPAVRLNELLPGDQLRRVYNGTAEERRAALMALDPEKRMKVLPLLPNNVFESLPDLTKERDEARDKQQKDRQAEQRRLRPPLVDLLDGAQREIALHGTTQQKADLFALLDAGTLEKVAQALPPAALADQPELRRMGVMARNRQQVVLDDLREAKLFRAIYSNRQLEEVLADFWFNHFNVFEGKGQPDRVMLASYERDAIRPHALGKFKDLLLAVARHPAMLYYLDNWESMSADVFQVGPFAPGPGGGPQIFSRQAHGLNENYGRELLELHTLGVNGGYTQQDVIAVARCFTGWTIRQPNQDPEFAYASFMHDDGEKIALGHKIAAGGGESDGLQVIDILARHPSTARFISTKLARHFVADDPPQALIEAMVRTFAKTDGDLRAVLETMFTSREFFSEGAWQSKVKSPLETLVSAVRALNGDALDTFTLVQDVADMGEPLYSKEPPTGYKDTADAWLSTANVMARIRFADALVNNKVPGVKVDLSRLPDKNRAEIARELLGRDPSPQTMSAIDAGLEGRQPGPETIATLLLSSPEFQRR
jgi:uncharacterized protein (DUF1800 family)